MNIVVLSGNLTNDVEIARTKNDILVGKGSIAVDRETAKKEVDYINFIVLGETNNYLAKYGKKGCRVEVSGSWQHTTYTNKDGKKVSKDECLVRAIKVLTKVLNAESKPVEVEKGGNDVVIDDDDLPF